MKAKPNTKAMIAILSHAKEVLDRRAAEPIEYHPSVDPKLAAALDDVPWTKIEDAILDVARNATIHRRFVGEIPDWRSRLEAVETGLIYMNRHAWEFLTIAGECAHHASLPTRRRATKLVFSVLSQLPAR